MYDRSNDVGDKTISFCLETFAAGLHETTDLLIVHWHVQVSLWAAAEIPVDLSDASLPRLPSLDP